MKVDINNLTEIEIDENFLKRITQKILKEEKISDGSVSLALVDGQTIKKLNKDYRGKDKETDVLSFAEVDNFHSENYFLSENNFLGEIVICPYQIKEGEKIAKVLIHGILHLLGYDHEKEVEKAKVMKEKEEKYATLI